MSLDDCFCAINMNGLLGDGHEVSKPFIILLHFHWEIRKIQRLGVGAGQAERSPGGLFRTQSLLYGLDQFGFHQLGNEGLEVLGGSGGGYHVF